MDARFRAARGALFLAGFAICFGSAAAGKPPEWQQDLDYLTWDRRAEEATGTAGRPVYLQPEGQRTAAVSNVAPTPSWQLRVRDIYSLVTPSGWRAMVAKRDAAPTATTTATLTVPAPGQAVQQPVGPVARRTEGPLHGTIVR